MGSGTAQAPTGRDRPGPSLRADRSFLIGAAASFLTLLLATEIASRIVVSRGRIYDSVDVAGVLTSLPELEERIRWAGRAERSILLLGDSVLGATALLERGEPEARDKTLPRALQELRRERVVSLGADGLLPLDLLAAARAVRESGRASRRTLVVLNFRMFARELDVEGKRLSRAFLAPALPSGERPGRGARSGLLDEEALSTRLFAATSSHLALFRTAQLLRTLWYFPTRRDSLQRLVESALGRPPVGDAEEAALRLRVLPYYRDPLPPDAPAVSALEAALAELGKAGGTVVVLSPQNPEVLAGAEESVASTREVLRAVARRAGVTETLDLVDRFPAALFLDHCHLTAAGNRRLAAEVSSRLGAGG